MRRLALVVSPVVIALCLGGLPSEAGALDGYYNCELKPSNVWCDGQANGTYDGIHSWDFNESWYPGAWDGTVTACQQLYRPSNGTSLTGGCSANWSATDYGTNTCICYEAEAKQISGGSHSINGHAIAD
jgi:hypothetical protein